MARSLTSTLVLLVVLLFLQVAAGAASVSAQAANDPVTINAQGSVAISGGTAAFRLTLTRATAGGPPSGSFTYTDSIGGVKKTDLRTSTFTTLTLTNDHSATVQGTSPNYAPGFTGTSCNFTLTVVDNGTPDTNDQFTIACQGTTGFSVQGGTISSGAIGVKVKPTITSANAVTFMTGTNGSFTVQTTGFPKPAITRGGASLPSGVTFTDNGDGTGTLSGTPGGGTGGSYAITFTAANSSGSTTQAFTLTVNQPAGISSAAATTFDIGTAGSFTVQATGFPKPSITRGGASLPSGVSFTDNHDGTGTLAGTPDPGTAGDYALTFTAHNGIGSDFVQNFTLTVRLINHAPTFTLAGNQSASEDASEVTVSNFVTAIDDADAGVTQVVTMSISGNTNAGLFSSISLSGTGASRDLKFTPAANAFGTATITIQAKDDGGTANGGADTTTHTADITITGVNDPPSFTKGADETVLEDSGTAGAHTVTPWATSISLGPNETGQTLQFNVTNNTDAGLFSSGPAVAPNGTLTYTLAANANGSATITLTLSDNGGGTDTSAPQTFAINVTAVNDAPTFTLAGNQTVNEDAGATTVTDFVTAISTGPSNESGQAIASVTISGNTNTG